MSHISEVTNFEIRNLNCLKEACKNLGFTFLENQTHYAWWGRWEGDWPLPKGIAVEDLGKCTHAISVPGCKYQIGVIEIKEKPGTYKMFYDFFSSGGLERVIGQNGGPLKAEYTHEVMKYIQQRGKAKRVTRQEQGDIVELTMIMR